MDQRDPPGLKRIAENVADEWGLVLQEPFQLSNYSYVAPVSDQAVLKIAWQEDDESVHEADALELWAGDGAVRLIRADRARRALLIERADPGSDLSAVDPAAATTIAVGVALRLWRPAAQPYRPVSDYVAQALADARPESHAARRLLERGRSVFDGLKVAEGTLVHGDFHHHNILAAGSRYLAIDPKPMVGDPEFDVPPFLWNPLGSQMTEEETKQRLAAFAKAGLDDSRMREWALIRGAYQCVGDWIGEHAVRILEDIQAA